MKMNLMKSIGIIIIAAGLGIIAMAFISPMLQLPPQIALALVGVVFICLGLLQMKREQDKRQQEARHRQLITKLDELQQELEKEDESRGKGAVIADVIASGLKYYAEHMTKPKKEAEND